MGAGGVVERGIRADQPAYAGMSTTFARVPLVLDPSELAGADVVIVGAPVDQATSYRPGARFGPRAIRQADCIGGPAARPSLRTGTDPLRALRIVDFGDVGTFPGGVANVHRELREALDTVLRLGALPVVLGGDHSISLPMLEALGEHFSADGYAVVHLDAHNDVELGGDEVDHGNPFSLAVARGVLRPDHKVCVGVRGYWPTTPAELEHWGARGMRTYTMGKCEELGIDGTLREIIAFARECAPRVYLTVDIDVLDPAFAPGTGTPEPGGLTTRELLRMVSRLSSELRLCALDLVEVSPLLDPAGITALAAQHVVLEGLAGFAASRPSRPPR